MNWNDIYCFLMDCEISLLDIKKAYKSLEDKLIKFENRINNSRNKTIKQIKLLKTFYDQTVEFDIALCIFNNQIRAMQEETHSNCIEED